MLFYLFLTIWHFYYDSHYLVNGTFLSIAFIFCELESLSKQDKLFQILILKNIWILKEK